MTEIYDYYRLLYSRAGTPPPELAGRPLTASRFSFNHEQGACPRCKGLGRLTVCDPERLVTDPARPLDGGALDGTKTGRFYGDPHGQYVAALRAAGRALGIDFSVPYDALGEEARRVAMFGTGDRSLRRRLVLQTQAPRRGIPVQRAVERLRKPGRRRNTSASTPTTAGRRCCLLMMEDPCPACGGARLKPDPLSPSRCAGLNIAELSALTVREASGSSKTRVVSGAPE